MFSLKEKKNIERHYRRERGQRNGEAKSGLEETDDRWIHTQVDNK